MVLLARVVRELQKQKGASLKEVERIERALDALRGIVTGYRRTEGKKRRRRKMSAEARKRIAAAQRRRWAKVRARKA